MDNTGYSVPYPVKFTFYYGVTDIQTVSYKTCIQPPYIIHIKDILLPVAEYYLCQNIINIFPVCRFKKGINLPDPVAHNSPCAAFAAT